MTWVNVLGLLEPSTDDLFANARMHCCYHRFCSSRTRRGTAAGIAARRSQLGGQDDVLGAHEVWRRIGWGSYRAQVHGDRYGGEAETFVERSGWGVEGITAGADLEDFDPVGAHVGDGVLAEALADVVASVEW